MAFIGLSCFSLPIFKKYLAEIQTMRGTILLLVTMSLLFSGCAGEPEPVDNVTDVTPPDITNDTEPVCLGPVCGADGNTYETDCAATDAGIAVLYNGTCVVEEECEDTDGGIVLDVAGTVTKGNDSYDDYCVDSDQLVEYACLDDDMEMATFSCGEGKECKDGECVETQEPEPEPELGCVGPLEPNIDLPSTTSFNGTVYADTCVDMQTVKDYYCRDGELQSINNQCPPGHMCTNGKCVELVYSCTDSDNGSNIMERGRTIGMKGYITIFDKWDSCVDEGMVQEHSCLENDTGKTEDIECGSGYKCSGDRCVESKCSETDGGFDIYKGGTTKDRDDEKDDNCLTDYKLKEYYCYGDEIKSKEKRCPEDYICLDDRCVVGSIS
jgi:hypothetical protein